MLSREKSICRNYLAQLVVINMELNSLNTDDLTLQLTAQSPLPKATTGFYRIVAHALHAPSEEVATRSNEQTGKHFFNVYYNIYSYMHYIVALYCISIDISLRI